MDNPLIIKVDESKKQILMRAGYPERVWEPCGRDKQGNQLWCSRRATQKDWQRRWELYMNTISKIIARQSENETETATTNPAP